MKKIFFFIVTLSAALVISCSGSSNSSSDAEYILSDFTAKDVDTTIYYSGIAGDCSAGSGCQAIIYQGEVSDIDYVGIAVKNTSHDVKIYWSGESIPVGTSLSIGGCTIKYDDTTVTNQTINVNIEATTSDTYTITFNNAITVGSNTISSGAVILAQFY